ncbi:MAG: ATP-binding protein, partial [Gammaproteobacteria bacterium]|nr:ATP-binding protein [Gammaproteobacteria bacterium]
MEKTTTASDNADRSPPDSKTAIADPIPVALDFLLACHEERRPLALVTGAAGTGKSLLMHRFTATVDAGPVAHIRNAHDDPHAFLEKLLGEFGFDAVESSVSDLIRLTRVFLLHEFRKGLRPIVIVENVDELGPETIDAIQELAMPEADEKPVSLFILTSSAGFDALSVAPQFESVYSLDVTVRTT